MPAPSYRVFLSAVSSELELARDAVRRDLRARGLTVTVQEEFRQEDDTATTLDKLHKYISELGDRSSGAVVCVIGKRSGDFPSDQAAAAYRQLLPDGFASGKVSYTQWELFFARHYNLRLSIHIAKEDFQPSRPVAAPHDDADSQQRFVDYIKHVAGLDREYFSTIDGLRADVLKQDWPQLQHVRPIHLPYPTLGELFKGRQEFMTRLRETLSRHTAGGGATAITGKAVHGLGGVGKTRLAVEYAWQHAEDYTAVLFVSADTPETLRQKIAELTGPLVLNLPEQDLAEEEARVAAALRWLQQHRAGF